MKPDNPSMVWVQKQEYFEKNKDKINEYDAVSMLKIKKPKISVSKIFHLFLL